MKKPAFDELLSSLRETGEIRRDFDWAAKLSHRGDCRRLSS